jgi:tungstate transport system ATP-binding protein
MKPADRPSGETRLAPPEGPAAAAAGWTPSPAAPAPLVTLRGAGVAFGATRALQGIDLTLRRGDRVALVGPNGSGKTTLLRLLHGLLPGTGERIVHDLQPEGRPPVAAMLFQRPFLLHLSAAWNVRLGLWLRGVPRAEHAQRCETALKRVGLARLARRPARELSGGQQQRLALARAWALQPDILFLDEPTASLDPGAKREVEALLAEVAADGITVVMSTHNLGQAKRLAARVVCLDEGRLLADVEVGRFFAGTGLPEAALLFLKGELAWAT